MPWFSSFSFSPVPPSFCVSFTTFFFNNYWFPFFTSLILILPFYVVFSLVLLSLFLSLSLSLYLFLSLNLHTDDDSWWWWLPLRVVPDLLIVTWRHGRLPTSSSHKRKKPTPPILCIYYIGTWLLQYYEAPPSLVDGLGYMNSIFTMFFSLECILKVAAFGIKV